MKLMDAYGDKAWGAIRGLDRIRLRGTFRWLASERGMATFLSSAGILLKDFGGWAIKKTQQVRAACEDRARELGIPFIYLRSGAVDKEAMARKIAADNGVKSGSVCMFSVVERCLSPTVVGNRATKCLELRLRPRQGVWIYHYWDHPQLGFGHVRLQSWLPMNVNICLNGRHWLERQLGQSRIAYAKDGNCFTWIADCRAAQELMNQQLHTNWPLLLDGLVRETCPALSTILAPMDLHSYWSAEETEWATDLMFRSCSDLERLYPSLLRHAMLISDSPSVLRFLGNRQVTTSGHPRGRFPAEVLSDHRRRYEGVRIKHWINRNSVKMYNKSGSVLRVETTINNTRDFKVFRRPGDDPACLPSWQKLRKGVSDLHRRCQVSDAANERYAAAVVDTTTSSQTLQDVVSKVSWPVTSPGRRSRALHPLAPDDHLLLTFLAKGELAVNGFRNRNLRAFLFPHIHPDVLEKCRRAAASTTRKIRLLRAHGLIHKLPGTNRYVVTDVGRLLATATVAAAHATIQKLEEIAA